MQDMGKSLGLIFPLICPLSFQLSLDCEVGACIQVTVRSSIWKSYATSVVKLYFYFGHQKTLYGRELYITMSCVERMWRGLHFLWVLFGSSVEKQANCYSCRMLVITDYGELFRWKALLSWCLLLPWTVLKFWTFLSSWFLCSITCLCWEYRISLA